MPTAGAALSSSWISSMVKTASSIRWAESAPTTRSWLNTGTRRTWVGMTGPHVGQPCCGRGRRRSAGTVSAIVDASTSRRLK